MRTLLSTTFVIGAVAALIANVVTALVVLVASLAVGAVVRVRSLRAGSRAHRAELAKRDLRETQLEEAGVRKHGLAAATTLVDRITAADPIIAAQLELDGLLDRYVVLELATARLAALVAERKGRPVPTTSPIRTEIRGRTLALRRTCEARLAAGRDELASIDELLQFLSQRTALAAAELETECVSERLALLDE
ncbi:MAG: hypothetical protein KF773_30975 [Deltaproteobacteria bacterium]|nr:hypothetical protein [Deltaproteobacteria bacterium]MCW5803618.1 hypothetical protein [Deltaproteobacteria bacterium]